MVEDEVEPEGLVYRDFVPTTVDIWAANQI